MMIDRTICPDCHGPKYRYARYCAKCKGIGARNPMYGRQQTAETRAKIAARAATRERPASRPEEHPRWRGDNASVGTGRDRARRMYPLQPCEICGSIRAERHHQDENPLNNSRENIQFLCRRHHKQTHAARHRRECAAADCARVADSRGLCSMHYQRVIAAERRGISR